MRTSLKMLERPWRATLQMVILVFKMTIVSLIYHAIGLLPIWLLLDNAACKHCLYLSRLDLAHPLACRAKATSLEAKIRLAYIIAIIPGRVKRINPI